MKASTLLLLAALAAGGPVSAQTVVKPQAKLTPAQSTVRNALYQLRDTLQLVEAASARIARDLASTSDAALRSRARVMVDRCRASLPQIDSARSVVAREALPDPDPKAVRRALDRSLVDLREQLQDCVTEFTDLGDPAKADTLRGYGIGRGKRVQAAIRNYRPVAAQYFKLTFDQPYWPSMAGAGATPSVY